MGHFHWLGCTVRKWLDLRLDETLLLNNVSRCESEDWIPRSLSLDFSKEMVNMLHQSRGQRWTRVKRHPTRLLMIFFLETWAGGGPLARLCDLLVLFHLLVAPGWRRSKNLWRSGVLFGQWGGKGRVGQWPEIKKEWIFRIAFFLLFDRLKMEMPLIQRPSLPYALR